MQAGRLRWRIRIDRQVPVQDDLGESTITWETFADNVPAAILGQSGRATYRQFFSAEQVQTEQLVEINIRWRAGVKEGMRVVRLTNEELSPEEIEVLSVEGIFADNITGRKWLTLTCRKRLEPGFWGEGL